jgi:hypothetical protein
MPVTQRRSNSDYLRYGIAVALSMMAILLVVRSYRWPLVWDAQMMHYANFLISKGFAPYRQIADMNTPGAYLIEGWAMHLFGGGDLAWRMYDFTLLGAICVSAIVIALPYDWIAGLFAGVMFALVHTSEGPTNSAQRDEAMTALLLVAYAFLFQSVRRQKPWMMILFGVCLGMAAAIKPTVAPLGFVLLAMLWWHLREQRIPAARYLWSGCAGGGIACAIIAAFFIHYQDASAFFAISRSVTPFYASLQHESFWVMCRHCLPKVAELMLPFAFVTALTNRQWKSWERPAILVAMGFGAVSYFAQGKGYPYHYYAFAAFTLLWIAIELMLAIRRKGSAKIIGVAGMLLGVVIMAPLYMHRLLLIHPVNQYAQTLEDDLTRLGGERLQGQVQCLDMVDGCFSALYRLKLVQSTNSMGDMLYFSRTPSSVVNYYRDQLWNDFAANSPKVIVISNEWFGEDSSFDKINQWPQFAMWLNANYTLSISRTFPYEGNHGYRIYLRKT